MLMWKNKKEYRTSEVASIIGVHPNTVRFYEEWGLISKPERKDNGYRVFTELHIRQIQLARIAFQIEVLQNGLRKKIIEVLKATAKCDFDLAIILVKEYINQLQREQKNAEEAIDIVGRILMGNLHENEMTMKRKEVSQYLGITMDALRNWEMNGLLTIKRKQNGYRVYTEDDIRRLKIIRSLRCANYSLEAILQMLNQLSENPDTNIKEALNLSEQKEDIISVCDKLLVSLTVAEENAHKMKRLLQEMKEDFS